MSSVNSTTKVAAPSYGTPVTITGTVGASQGGAAQIVAPYTVVTGSGGNVSAILPASPIIGQVYLVELSGVSTQLVLFPQVGGQIDSLGVNAFILYNTNSISQISRIRGFFIATSSTQWRYLGQFADATGYVVNDTAQNQHYGPHIFHGTTQLLSDVTITANTGFSYATTLAPSSTTSTISWATASTQKVDSTSTTGTLVLTFTNPLDGGRYILKTIGKTGRSWTFPSSVKWASGIAPTVTATDGAKDMFAFYYDAGDSIYIGQIVAQNVS